MAYCQGLITLCLIGLTYSIETLTPGTMRYLFPEPDNIFTKWQFNTSIGSKLSLKCTFESENCKEARIFLIRDEVVTEHCSKDLKLFEKVLYETSDKNSMDIIIQNTGLDNNSYCEIQATKPYLNYEIPDTYSAEGGEENNEVRSGRHCRCGWVNKNPQRIVNGDEADINEFPFVAAILENFNGETVLMCGASIITSNALITAAHCLIGDDIDLEMVTIVIGEHDLTYADETPVTKTIYNFRFIPHHEYDSKTFLNDIGIIILDEPIEFNDWIGPICLPSNHHGDLVNSNVKVAGWGLDADDEECGETSRVLKKVYLNVLNPEICDAVYFEKQISMLCTYRPKKDSCRGDSGSPLFAPNSKKMFQQIALVSNRKKCGSTNPTRNTDIRYFIKWIMQIIADENAGELCF